MNYKKVPGERIIAAIIDSFIVTIIEVVPVIIYFIFYGFESIFDFYIGGSGMMETGTDYNVFIAITTSAGIVIGVLYFSFLPYKWNGQTLGKKILNIKAIDEFGNNPTFKQHLIRAIQNYSRYIAVLVLPLLYVNFIAYGVVSGLLGFIAQGILFISIILLLAREDGKGLHDMLANTYVVKADIDLDKDFIEKTTQMENWADVDYDKKTKSDDDWYSNLDEENNDDKDDDDYWG